MPRRKLTDLKLNELQEKYREVTGEATRNPNKKSLIAKILAAEAATREREKRKRLRAKAASPEGTTEASPPAPSADMPKPPRGRFRNMTIAELVARYAQVVGRPTESQDRGYLIWKIREAEKGRVRTGPLPERRKREKGELQVLPFPMKRASVPAFDEMWRAKGYRSRSAFLADATATRLKGLGFDPSPIFDEQNERTE